jgi:hypothetical protein
MCTHTTPVSQECTGGALIRVSGTVIFAETVYHDHSKHHRTIAFIESYQTAQMRPNAKIDGACCQSMESSIAMEEGMQLRVSY